MDDILSAVESLYHMVIFKKGLGKTCICISKCACESLKERIQKNLRIVLCDMILLDNISKKNEPTLV